MVAMRVEPPWVAVKEVCHMYGLTYDSAKNRIAAGTFPVSVYKVGKNWVIDKVVHAEFFARHREAGLQVLNSVR